VSEVCAEVPASSTNAANAASTDDVTGITAVVNASGVANGVVLAACVCKPGWTRFEGFLANVHGCYPTEVVQGAAALLTDTLTNAAATLHAKDVSDTNHQTLTWALNHPRDAPTYQVALFWTSVVVVGLSAFVLGGVVVVMGVSGKNQK